MIVSPPNWWRRHNRDEIRVAARRSRQAEHDHRKMVRLEEAAAAAAIAAGPQLRKRAEGRPQLNALAITEPLVGDWRRSWVESAMRLDPAEPTGDFPPARWSILVRDVSAFLLGPHAAQAIALGWDALDLFGADDSRPYARIDQAGLVVLLNGDQPIELTAEAAVIATSTGARQTFRRRPGAPGRVLFWELAGYAVHRVVSRQVR
jgi:hypothetical protein